MTFILLIIYYFYLLFTFDYSLLIYLFIIYYLLIYFYLEAISHVYKFELNWSGSVVFTRRLEQ